MRRLARRTVVSLGPARDPAKCAAMGITVPDREGTPEGPSKARPVVGVDTRQPLTRRTGRTPAFASRTVARSATRCVKGQRLQHTIAKK